MALCLFILYIHHCQLEADAQILRCPKWARCSDAVLLDFLMRVSPQIHPCLQSPGLAHDSLCVAAELPIVHESIAGCLNSRVIFLVQAISLHQIGDLPNSVHASHSARGTNFVDHGSWLLAPQSWATQWTTLLWSGFFFFWTKLDLWVGSGWSITGWPLKWPLCYLWASEVLAKVNNVA